MTTPGLPRRFAAMVYEALLLFAVAFFAAWLFLFASGGRDATSGWLRHKLQAFIGLMFAAYFLWCWLRGGQTLAMKAWRIKLVGVTPGKALLRLVLASVLLPTGFSVVWTFFDAERQFLHDRLAGTRLTSIQDQDWVSLSPEASMDAKQARPFDSIESAHEFVAFLADRVEEAIKEVQGHSDQAKAESNERRVEALAVALLKMNQLSTHMQKSRRILNDLRTLRRLLFQERDAK